MRISNDLPLYRITVPTPFPVGPVNLYIITEPEFILIDCGPATKAARTAVDTLMAEDGLDPARIQRIILTHSHQDHYGLAAELSRRSGAPVYAHPDDEAAIRHDPSVATFMQRMLHDSGTPAELIAKIVGFMHYLSGVSEGVPNVLPVADLDGVRCGQAHFKFVHLPGHTPGSIGLWDEDRRILIGGDTAIERITPNPFTSSDPTQPNGRFRSLAHYWETFARVRDMQPSIIHAGHAGPITEFPAYHDWSWDLHKRRQEAIITAVQGGAQTVHEVAGVLFPEAVKEGSFLALTEVFSHLDLLEEEGRVQSRVLEEAGIPRWHTKSR